MSLKMVTSMPFEKRMILYGRLANQVSRGMKDIKYMTDEQLDEIVTKIGQLNALAFKGYRPLKDDWKLFNEGIYEIKDAYVYDLAVEYHKRHLDVSFFLTDKIVYFRRMDGIQISFHLPNLTDKESWWLQSNLPFGKWDGVEHAYSFIDPQEYKEMIEQRKKAEVVVLEIAQKYKAQGFGKMPSLSTGYPFNYRYWLFVSTCYQHDVDKIRVIKMFFDEVDETLKEQGLSFKVSRGHQKLTQTKMGRKTFGKPKKRTSSRKKVA